MHGFDIGVLEVKTSNMDTGVDESVWRRSHDQGDDWLYGKVELSEEGFCNMVLQATTPAGGKGDIALDDIMLDFGPCHTGRMCNFEEGNICGFEQSLNDDFDWQLVVASDAEGEVRSSAGDHSLQTPFGHYLKHSSEGTAVIYTSEIDPYYKCVEFYIYLNGFAGHHASDLYIYTRRNGVLDPDPSISITDLLGDDWNRFLLPVTSTTPYSLAFESHVRGSGYIVALDDIKPLTTCEPMTECNFETDFCMWKNVVDEGEHNFDWSITTCWQRMWGRIMITLMATKQAIICI